jgi:hypothetical protein
VPTETPSPEPCSGRAIRAISIFRQTGVDAADGSLGSPDHQIARVGTQPGAELVLELECEILVSDITVFIIYERQNGPGIFQDQQVISVGDDHDLDGEIEWTVVYVFGDDPSEESNTFIPSEELYHGYAFIVDLSHIIGRTFKWVRFQNYPIGVPRPTDEQIEIDAVLVLNIVLP